MRGAELPTPADGGATVDLEAQALARLGIHGAWFREETQVRLAKPLAGETLAAEALNLRERAGTVNHCATADVAEL